MSHSDDIIYDYPPVYDEYKDDDWYSWTAGSSIIKDNVLYNRSEKINEGDYVLALKIPKQSILVIQPCAAVRKQGPRVRSPLDRSEFWICCSRLIDARSDRWDFLLEFSARSYDFPKLLFVHVCTVVGKQVARIRSPLDRSDFWICDPRLIDARSDHWDFRWEHSTGSYSSPKLLQFVNFRGLFVKIMSKVTPLFGKFNHGDGDDLVYKICNFESFEGGLLDGYLVGVDQFKRVHSMVHEKRSNYSFDPYGCNSDSSCQAKGKLEDEFFQEGEYDAEASRLIWNNQDIICFISKLFSFLCI